MTTYTNVALTTPKIHECHEDHLFYLGYTNVLLAAPITQAHPMPIDCDWSQVVQPLKATGLTAARRQFFKAIRRRLIERTFPQ